MEENSTFKLAANFLLKSDKAITNAVMNNKDQDLPSRRCLQQQGLIKVNDVPLFKKFKSQFHTGEQSYHKFLETKRENQTLAVATLHLTQSNGKVECKPLKVGQVMPIVSKLNSNKQLVVYSSQNALKYKKKQPVAVRLMLNLMKRHQYEQLIPSQQLSVRAKYPKLFLTTDTGQDFKRDIKLIQSGAAAFQTREENDIVIRPELDNNAAEDNLRFVLKWLQEYTKSLRNSSDAVQERTFFELLKVMIKVGISTLSYEQNNTLDQQLNQDMKDLLDNVDKEFDEAVINTQNTEMFYMLPLVFFHRRTLKMLPFSLLCPVAKRLKEVIGKRKEDHVVSVKDLEYAQEITAKIIEQTYNMIHDSSVHSFDADDDTDSIAIASANESFCKQILIDAIPFQDFNVFICDVLTETSLEEERTSLKRLYLSICFAYMEIWHASKLKDKHLLSQSGHRFLNQYTCAITKAITCAKENRVSLAIHYDHLCPTDIALTKEISREKRDDEPMDFKSRLMTKEFLSDIDDCAYFVVPLAHDISEDNVNKKQSEDLPLENLQMELETMMCQYFHYVTSVRKNTNSAFLENDIERVDKTKSDIYSDLEASQWEFKNEKQAVGLFYLGFDDVLADDQKSRINNGTREPSSVEAQNYVKRLKNQPEYYYLLGKRVCRKQHARTTRYQTKVSRCQRIAKELGYNFEYDHSDEEVTLFPIANAKQTNDHSKLSKAIKEVLGKYNYSEEELETSINQNKNDAFFMNQQSRIVTQDDLTFFEQVSLRLRLEFDQDLHNVFEGTTLQHRKAVQQTAMTRDMNSVITRQFYDQKNTSKFIQIVYQCCANRLLKERYGYNDQMKEVCLYLPQPRKKSANAGKKMKISEHASVFDFDTQNNSWNIKSNYQFTKNMLPGIPVKLPKTNGASNTNTRPRSARQNPSTDINLWYQVLLNCSKNFDWIAGFVSGNFVDTDSFQTLCTGRLAKIHWPQNVNYGVYFKEKPKWYENAIESVKNRWKSKSTERPVSSYRNRTVSTVPPKPPKVLKDGLSKKYPTDAQITELLTLSRHNFGQDNKPYQTTACTLSSCDIMTPIWSNNHPNFFSSYPYLKSSKSFDLERFAKESCFTNEVVISDSNRPTNDWIEKGDQLGLPFGAKISKDDKNSQLARFSKFSEDFWVMGKNSDQKEFDSKLSHMKNLTFGIPNLPNDGTRTTDAFAEQAFAYTYSNPIEYTVVGQMDRQVEIESSDEKSKIELQMNALSALKQYLMLSVAPQKHDDKTESMDFSTCFPANQEERTIDELNKLLKEFKVKLGSAQVTRMATLAQDQLSEAKDAETQRQQEIDTLNKSVQDLNSKLAQLEEQVEEYENFKKFVIDLRASVLDESTAAVSDDPETILHAILKKYNDVKRESDNNSADLKKVKSELEATKTELSEKIESLTQETEEKNNLQIQLEGLKAEKTTLEEQLHTIEKALKTTAGDDIDEKIKTLIKTFTEHENKVSELAQLKATIKQKNTEIESLKEQMKALQKVSGLCPEGTTEGEKKIIEKFTELNNLEEDQDNPGTKQEKYNQIWQLICKEFQEMDLFSDKDFKKEQQIKCITLHSYLQHLYEITTNGQDDTGLTEDEAKSVIEAWNSKADPDATEDNLSMFSNGMDISTDEGISHMRVSKCFLLPFTTRGGGEKLRKVIDQRCVDAAKQARNNQIKQDNEELETHISQMISPLFYKDQQDLNQTVVKVLLSIANHEFPAFFSAENVEDNGAQGEDAQGERENMESPEETIRKLFQLLDCFTSEETNYMDEGDNYYRLDPDQKTSVFTMPWDLLDIIHTLHDLQLFAGDDNEARSRLKLLETDRTSSGPLTDLEKSQLYEQALKTKEDKNRLAESLHSAQIKELQTEIDNLKQEKKGLEEKLAAAKASEKDSAEKDKNIKSLEDIIVMKEERTKLLQGTIDSLTGEIAEKNNIIANQTTSSQSKELSAIERYKLALEVRVKADSTLTSAQQNRILEALMVVMDSGNEDGDEPNEADANKEANTGWFKGKAYTMNEKYQRSLWLYQLLREMYSHKKSESDEAAAEVTDEQVEAVIEEVKGLSLEHLKTLNTPDVKLAIAMGKIKENDNERAYQAVQNFIQSKVKDRLLQRVRELAEGYVKKQWNELLKDYKDEKQLRYDPKEPIKSNFQESQNFELQGILSDQGVSDEKIEKTLILLSSNPFFNFPTRHMDEDPFDVFQTYSNKCFNLQTEIDKALLVDDFNPQKLNDACQEVLTSASKLLTIKYEHLYGSTETDSEKRPPGFANEEYFEKLNLRQWRLNHTGATAPKVRANKGNDDSGLDSSSEESDSKSSSDSESETDDEDGNNSEASQVPTPRATEEDIQLANEHLKEEWSKLREYIQKQIDDIGKLQSGVLNTPRKRYEPEPESQSNDVLSPALVDFVFPNNTLKEFKELDDVEPITQQLKELDNAGENLLEDLVDGKLTQGIEGSQQAKIEELQGQLEKQKEEHDKDEKKITQLSKEIEGLKENNKSGNTEAEETGQTIEKQKNAILRLKKEKKQADDKITELHSKLELTEKQLQELREQDNKSPSENEDGSSGSDDDESESSGSEKEDEEDEAVIPDEPNPSSWFQTDPKILKLRTEVSKLQNELREAKEAKERLEQNIKTLEATNEDLQNKLTKSKSESEDRKKRIVELEAKLSKLQKDNTSQPTQSAQVVAEENVRHRDIDNLLRKLGTDLHVLNAIDGRNDTSMNQHDVRAALDLMDELKTEYRRSIRVLHGGSNSSNSTGTLVFDFEDKAKHFMLRNGHDFYTLDNSCDDIVYDTENGVVRVPCLKHM